MCYSLSNRNATKKLNELLKKPIRIQVPVIESNFHSGFAHPSLHIIRQDEPGIVQSGKWGLVPGFINDPLKAKEYFVNTLNAKAETVFEKVSFKKAIRSQRCLIPASGFFEWRDINKTKYPYYIGLKNQELFMFGGLYDTWKNNITGEETTTFSIITTPANPLMAKIHNLKLRQPLIFTSENENNWLNPDLTENDLTELMQPLGDSLMTAHTIKKISPKNADVFSDELIQAYEYPELAFYE